MLYLQWWSQTTETQRLLSSPSHEPTERVMTITPWQIPLILLVPLLVLPLLLLPHVFNTAHSPNLHLRAANSNSTIHLLSLNMFIRPRFIGSHDQKDKRLTDLLQPFLQHDLLCLQELFWTTGKRKERFLTLLQGHFPYSAHAPRQGFRDWLSFPPKAIDAGLAIMSTRRILATGFHMYTVSAWNSVDWFVAKGVLYAQIEVSGGTVHVFTTHMQAGDDFGDVRSAQIGELVEFVKRIVTDDAPVIVAGDLNVNGRRGYGDGGDSGEYERMMKKFGEVGLVDVMKRFLGQAVTTAGGLWGERQRNERIDYLLMRKGVGVVASVKDGGVRVEELRARGKDYRTMSDHYAVVAEILVRLRRGDG